MGHGTRLLIPREFSLFLPELALQVGQLRTQRRPLRCVGLRQRGGPLVDVLGERRDFRFKFNARFVDILRNALVEHDDVDDRKNGRDIAAPQDSDGQRAKQRRRHGELVAKREGDDSIEVVHLILVDQAS
jgi:hypothetical protein